MEILIIYVKYSELRFLGAESNIIVREWKNMEKICRKCNKTYTEDISYCPSCGENLLEQEQSSAQVSIVSNAPSDAIVLQSSAPIPSKCGWCKWGYIAGLLLCVAGIGVIILILVFIIEHFQMTFHKDKMRRMKFKFIDKASSDEIYNKLQPALTKKYGGSMTFDREGETLSVSYDGLIYDINVGEDSTFSIWWRKSISGAIFSWNEWKEYKKIRTGTALVAYEIQEAFGIK